MSLLGLFGKSKKSKRSFKRSVKRSGRKTRKLHVGPEGGVYKIRVVNGHRKKVYY